MSKDLLTQLKEYQALKYPTCSKCLQWNNVQKTNFIDIDNTNMKLYEATSNISN